METHTLTDEEIENFVKKLIADNKIEEFIYAIEVITNDEISDDTIININKNEEESKSLEEKLEIKENESIPPNN